MISFGANEWTSVRSRNFYVVGEVPEAEVRNVTERLEQFRDVFSQLFPQFASDTKTNANVIVFRDAESYRPFKPKRPDGQPDDGIAGYFLAAESVNYITLAMNSGKTDPFHTIFHEYIHFLLKSRSMKNDLPPWLTEGLAQYYETLQITPDNKVVLGSAPQGRIGTLRQGEFMPSSELFSVERTAIHGNGSLSRSMFYAQSWLLVHYLFQQGDGRASDRLVRFLALLRENNSTEIALKQIYGIDPAKLNDLLAAYLQQPSLPIQLESVISKPAAGSQSKANKVTESEAQTYLGDVLLNMGRLDEAESYLKMAIAADNNLSQARSSYGLLLIRQNKFAEAAAQLEFAVADVSANYFVYFNYAYALSRANASGGFVKRFPAADAAKMREALQKSISLEPGFAPSYRILAFIYFVNGENLAEAVNLLEKGLSLSPGDETFEILLAKTLVRLERYEDARGYLENLTLKARDAEVRADAEKLLSSVTQYFKAKLQISATASSRGIPWSPSLVLLKRSWVTEADLAAAERMRQQSNLNRALERSRPNESRIVGTIQDIECTSGSIIYKVNSKGETLRFFGERFDDLRMAVLVSGQHSFKVDCGARLPSDPAVLSFITPSDKRLAAKPKLMSITFVPEDFELHTPEQLANSRQVVIENDLLKRVYGNSEQLQERPIDTDARWNAIRGDLRPAGAGETRVVGTLLSVDCSGSTFAGTANVSGRDVRFSSDPNFMPKWFSVEASQVSLNCGSTPGVTNVLFTYRRPEQGNEGILRLSAMEFLPPRFPTGTVIEPSR